MPVEKLRNEAIGTLSLSLNTSDTTVTLVDASLFPTAGPFRIRINEEIMTVTSVSGEEFTVIRATEGPGTVGSHSVGALVRLVVTRGVLDNLNQFQANNQLYTGRRLHIFNDKGLDIASIQADGILNLSMGLLSRLVKFFIFQATAVNDIGPSEVITGLNFTYDFPDILHGLLIFYAELGAASTSDTIEFRKNTTQMAVKAFESSKTMIFIEYFDSLASSGSHTFDMRSLSAELDFAKATFCLLFFEQDHNTVLRGEGDGGDEGRGSVPDSDGG